MRKWCEWRMGLNVGTTLSGIDRSIPICDAFIDPTLPLPDLQPCVRRVCKLLIPEWSLLPDSCFSVTPVSGGITNLLLKVSMKSEEGNEKLVTVRVFGPNTDAVIDRKREFQAIPSLSSAGFGAKLLAVFRNGMVQSFIDARTLIPEDLSKPELAVVIAKELRRLHELEVPGSKEPQLWPDIFKFLEKASTVTFDDTLKQQRYETISFIELREEMHELMEVSKSMKAPIVFAHNDLLSGNLMYNEENGTLYMIDFEYGSYNYRGYDIANHFAEYAGFECDYNLYPGRDAQYHFFRYYLCPNNPLEVSEEELKHLYVETNFYALASHIFWAVWAIVQAKFSPIDFDYLDYFFQRYNEYKRRKSIFISMAVSYVDYKKPAS